MSHRLKHSLLVSHRDRRVEDVDLILRRVIEAYTHQRVFFRIQEQLVHDLDLVPPGQKHKHVSVTGPCEHVGDQQSN